VEIKGLGCIITCFEVTLDRVVLESSLELHLDWTERAKLNVVFNVYA
jgi:hypothetical protein